MTQRYLEQQLSQSPGSVLIISENAPGGGHTVLAPLPETFGFTVGSEFSAPFDTGISSGIVQKALAIGSISQKIGLRMKKMYSNPEPTEISFDLEFNAFYSAADEVVVPVIKLAALSLGRSMDKLNERTAETIRSVAQTAGNVGNLIADKTDDQLSDDATTGNIIKRLANLIGLIEGPNTQTIMFGNLYTMTDCYITSMSPQFSNVLDKNGLPMSATCSITVTLEQYPIADDVVGWFHDASVDVNRGAGGFTASPSGSVTLGDYVD